ncbi:MAG: calycin-like domain-containing protein [Bacteroidales bacterium]|nr:calycin-like domain-containing protein [Candidatus Sodaliphilus aphodohippi]
MKKVLFMLVAAVCSLAATATDYTGRLTVAINGEGTQQGTTISINENGGKYDLSLNNFKLISGDDVMGVGNISLTGVEATEAFGIKTIKFDAPIIITEGNDPEITWVGPLLEEVPLKLVADFDKSVLSVSIDIDMMESLEQIINVKFVGSAGGLKGDMNDDNKIDIVDVNAIINKILGL